MAIMLPEVLTQPIVKDRAERLVKPLLYAWGIASVAIGLVVLGVRLASGPVNGPWLRALVFVWTAPFLAMLLWLVAGWVWFALWLIVRPFKRLRESRFMHPERW